MREQGFPTRIDYDAINRTFLTTVQETAAAVRRSTVRPLSASPIALSSLE